MQNVPAKISPAQLETLGDGNFGRVVKCRFNNNGNFEIVAVKKLQDIQMFHHEAQVHCIREHPNIVKMLGVVETNLEIVMEFVEGETLLEAINELSIEKVFNISHQIANGLSHLHNTAKVVHVGLTSNNIMLVRATGQVKIIGFGSARKMMGHGPNYIPPNERFIHKEHHPPGFLNYMEATPDLDMWCYGRILNKMMEHVSSSQFCPQRDNIARQILSKIIVDCGQWMRLPMPQSSEVLTRLRLP